MSFFPFLIKITYEEVLWNHTDILFLLQISYSFLHSSFQNPLKVLLESVVTVMIAKWWYSGSIFLSTLISYSTIRKHFPSPSFIYHLGGLMDSCFIQWVIIHYSLYLCWCSDYPNCVQCLLTAISYILLSFPISITLWALSYFLAYQLVLSLPQPWSPSFLQGATFCSVGNSILIPIWVPRRMLLGPFSGKLGTHIHTYVCTYFLYVY